MACVAWRCCWGRWWRSVRERACGLDCPADGHRADHHCPRPADCWRPSPRTGTHRPPESRTAATILESDRRDSVSRRVRVVPMRRICIRLVRRLPEPSRRRGAHRGRAQLRALHRSHGRHTVGRPPAIRACFIRWLLLSLALFAAANLRVTLVTANLVVTLLGFAALGAGVALLVPAAMTAVYSRSTQEPRSR